MRFFVLSLLLNISIVTSAQQAIANSPIFQRVVFNSDEKVYDTKAWSYHTGSPVRSTVLVNGNYTYFGNAAGEFYCLNKKTGLLKWKYQTGQAIHSSAISSGGRIFFSDNKQTVYALDEASGKLVWELAMGERNWWSR